MKNSLPYIALVLAVAMVVLTLLSWIITAAMPDVAMRSLLSAEGIRWFFGHFAENMATPLLVWLLLGTLAYGADVNGGLFSKLQHIRGQHSYRERVALKIVATEVAIFVLVLVLLTLIPQAILLSVTGSLFPSSFSQSIVPSICFILMVIGATYGIVSGRLNSVKDVFRSLSSGFLEAGSLFLLYVLAAELYFSIRFVFQI